MGNFQRLFLRWLFWSLRLVMIWSSVEELLARLICTTSFFVATYGGGCISSLRISTNWLRTTCSCCCCSSSRAVPSFSSTSGSWLRRGGFHHRRPAKAKAMMTNALPTGPQIDLALPAIQSTFYFLKNSISVGAYCSTTKFRLVLLRCFDLLFNILL